VALSLDSRTLALATTIETPSFHLASDTRFVSKVENWAEFAKNLNDLR
jgi:hypothetical protein